MTRTLYLLRHAKSSWDSPGQDHERPLAPRGRRASARMAEHLRDARIVPELVLCSSSARTQQTLEAIRSGLGDDVRIAIEPGLYAAGLEQLLARLRMVEAEVQSVMLIGHQPGMQDLALWLAGEGKALKQVQQKFPTAALATLRLECDWRDLTPGAARLAAFIRPRDLG